MGMNNYVSNQKWNDYLSGSELTHTSEGEICSNFKIIILVISNQFLINTMLNGKLLYLPVQYSALSLYALFRKKTLKENKKSILKIPICEYGVRVITVSNKLNGLIG